MPAALLSLVLSLLTGCAVNPRLDLSQFETAGQPAVLLDTPFFPQTENQCGPAALATVLAASGVDTAPAALAAEVYLPAREGSLQVELLAATRRHGRIPYPLAPGVDALLSELGHGRPVLLLQNLRTPGLPAWHYAVLTGYDIERNAFRLNSGAEQGLWLQAPPLLRTWNWADRWAMVALRPGELPARGGTAGASGAGDDRPVDRYVRAVADFEAVAGAGAALPAWRAAAERWPGHHWPALALGNQAYQGGDLDAAANWYSRGLARQPDHPALANNLAAVLGEAGCARAGEALLRPVAAALDGDSAWNAAIDETLRELAAQDGADPGACEAFGPGAQPPPAELH